MNELDMLQDFRGVWLRHRADNKKRLEIAQREINRADGELDAIDNRIAALRLEAAAALLETGAVA